MALVRLRGPLKRLAGDRAEHAIEGATVARAAASSSSARIPAASGWILDERGALRRHINVFVNGELRRDGHAGRGRRQDRRPPGDLRRMSDDDRAARRDQEGPVRARGRAGRAVRGDRARVRRRAGRVSRCATRARAAARLGHLAVLRPEDLVHGRPRGRVGAGGRRRAARRRGRGARADLGDRGRRGGRHAVRRRRSRRAVREPRRRRELGAQPRALGAPDAAGLAAGRRRAVPALDRDLARRAGPARAWRSPPPGCG